MRAPVAVLAALLLASACGGSSGPAPAASPEATFERFRSSVVARDFGALYELIDPAIREKTEADWAEQKKLFETPQGKLLAEQMGLDAGKIPTMSAKEFFLAGVASIAEKEGSLAKIAAAKVVSTSVDGDEATVRFTTGDKEKDMPMIRSGGEWYIGGDMLLGMPGGGK